MCPRRRRAPRGRGWAGAARQHPPTPVAPASLASASAFPLAMLVGRRRPGSSRGTATRRRRAPRRTAAAPPAPRRELLRRMRGCDRVSLEDGGHVPRLRAQPSAEHALRGQRRLARAARILDVPARVVRRRGRVAQLREHAAFVRRGHRECIATRAIFRIQAQPQELVAFVELERAARGEARGVVAHEPARETWMRHWCDRWPSLRVARWWPNLQSRATCERSTVRRSTRWSTGEEKKEDGESCGGTLPC